MRPYLVFALLGVLVYLSVKGLVFLNWPSSEPTYTLEIILFLVFITSFIYRYILRFASQGAQILTQFYLLSIAIKLLAGCSFITALILLDKQNATGNVLLFLAGYILFTVTEIMFLMRLKNP